jgi:ABC-2 type transport system permease protein
VSLIQDYALTKALQAKSMGIKKYSAIIKTTWQRALVYRFSVAAHRVGEISEMLIVILMWSAIYGNQAAIKGYTLREMITYVLIGNLITVIVRNWMYEMVSKDIKDGTLSIFLVRPQDYFRYMVAREIGRISLAFIASVLTNIAVMLFFSHVLIVNTDILHLLLILLIVAFAFVTEILISYIIGLVAFWTDEVNGVFATVDKIKKFFAGNYFPVNLLPATYVQISFFLPFGYSFFIPTQIYLNRLDLITGFKGCLVQLVWIAILYGIIKIIWRRGLVKYEGVGI